MAESITLRDGSTTSDERLDRLVQFDERSREYPIGAVIPADTKNKTWRLHQRLNQFRQGACTGFGTTHRIAALPISFGGATNEYALKIYNRAKQLDEWPGEDYEGSSVLGAVKAAQELGHFPEYRWCFTIEDYLRAVSNEGPVIVGSDWYEGMFEPDERGLLHPGGTVAGGHCYLIRGLTLEPRGVRKGVGPVFRITNSWGEDWGENGEAFITVEDFEKYIMPNGEGCVPTESRVKRAGAQATEHRLGRGNFPWAPGGSSLFDRVLGFPYTPGQNRLTGKGSPAGRFAKGAFRLGR